MQALDTAFAPIFMKLMKYKTKENLEEIKKYFYIVPFLIDALFPIQYKGDYMLIPILAMGYVFLAIRKMFANILVYYKKSIMLSLSGYFPAFVNLGLNSKIWYVCSSMDNTCKFYII